MRHNSKNILSTKKMYRLYYLKIRSFVQNRTVKQLSTWKGKRVERSTAQLAHIHSAHNAANNGMKKKHVSKLMTKSMGTGQHQTKQVAALSVALELRR